MKKEKNVFGTYEWAAKTVNVINGCSYNCKYCYAKAMAVRFKRKTKDNWHIEEVNLKQLKMERRKTDGLVMFPSTHDITPVNIQYSIELLKNLIDAGDKVLIVTKPHLEVVKEICEIFKSNKENILFRFTIGSNDSETLKFWETDAPDYNERKSCLVYAFYQGFSTSVSCEPMLDGNTLELVNQLLPFVTDAIWIGKPNKLLSRLKFNGETDEQTISRANNLIELQSDEYIKSLYESFKDCKKVKWKDSIKKIVDIEIPTTRGLDI
jgi:DNA repair photolyase